MITVEVEGCTELAAAFTSGAVAESLADTTTKIGAQIKQASEARASSPQMRRSVRSNEVSIDRTGVTFRIGGGGGDGRWAVGAQFGSTRFRQFPGASGDGYTVLPAVNDAMPDIEESLLDAITSALT